MNTPPFMRSGASASSAVVRNGLLIGKGGLHGNCLRIAPSLLVTESELDEGCRLLDAALAAVK